MWHVQVYIFTPKPFQGIFEVEKIHATIAPRRTFYAGIRDVACPAYMVTRSCHRQLLDGMEYALEDIARAGIREATEVLRDSSDV
jgi:hypothetical protein